jgi:uncharacterized protein
VKIPADSLYLDASAFVPLHVADALSGRARALISSWTRQVVVSDLTIAEFSSVIARRFRALELTKAEAAKCISNGETWVSRFANPVEMTGHDLKQAIIWIQSLDLPLRTPDALHLAIAMRLEARLMTFDRQMAQSAASLGIEVLLAE